MARIRSVHPGLFSDEAFVSLSMAARVLLIGVWTEADDHGVFEWKPVTLKIRVMPVDNVDVEELLAEMVAADSIRKFTSSGKSYGLVRNFCRYQRPKKPKYTFFMPTELHTYAGLKEDGSLPVLHQSSTDPEKPSQREEGGDLRKEESGGGERSPARISKGSSKEEGSLLDFAFEPSLDAVSMVKGKGFGDEQFRSELSKFMAYYMAKGAHRADWNAALVLWFERAKADPVPSGPIAKKFHVKTDTEQWRAWCKHLGKTPATDRNFGWFFDSEWPPGYAAPRMDA